jgi:hypothetical protein
LQSPNKVEIIDLTSPTKELDTTSSLEYDEDDRSSPVSLNGNINFYKNYNVIKHPFKRPNNNKERNIFPAGYESEFSSDSDEFDIY